ncbi:glutathione S-transferase [Cupriavidus sp. CV2]|uniref:glutathione S-transferase family protein n=1 Tax=Cupriavidus ulmosensis TaxID=3065913 RepID=UPI00296A9464|nr:glutathione S-transferase [Cupriavidus sp. CV2]MDW3683728.1 glutathione S-transferase [Cupriavidus sp. CV2]
MTNDSMLTVLGRANSSNVQKVMWLLAEIGQPCVRVDMGGQFGGNNEVDYLRKNPNGVVPTLLDMDTVVWESNTILRYRSNRFGAFDLYPADPVRRAWVERWMDWQLSTLGPANTLLFQSIVRTPISQRSADLIESHRERNAKLFVVLDEVLDGRRYLGGDGLTLADIAIGPLTYRWFELPLERPSYKHLRRWYDLICQRPAFREHIIGIGLS